MPSSLDESDLASSIAWRSLIACDFWLTHWIGSVWSVELVLDGDAADEDRRRSTTASGIAAPAGSAAEPHDEPAERALAEVAGPWSGDLYSRMPRIASGTMIEHRQIDGDADREQQAEVADHRHLGEAQRGEGEDRVERHDEQRGTEVARRLLDRVLGAVDDHLLLDARVHLDRVVDADAEHHRQAGDGDERQRDAEIAGEAERPDDADEHDARAAAAATAR